MLVKLARVLSLISIISFIVILVCFIASLVPNSQAYKDAIIPILLVAFVICFLSGGMSWLIFRWYLYHAAAGGTGKFIQYIRPKTKE
ncbi:hypothetical protein HY312_01920 [Candidatus Saccharibacteria bacterium]|nr:hypothetical protein [Candidatus Saccharibacteria bacterium]